jgi:hypothetical protein
MHEEVSRSFFGENAVLPFRLALWAAIDGPDYTQPLRLRNDRPEAAAMRRKPQSERPYPWLARVGSMNQIPARRNDND